MTGYLYTLEVVLDNAVSCSNVILTYNCTILLDLHATYVIVYPDFPGLCAFVPLFIVV